MARLKVRHTEVPPNDDDEGTQPFAGRQRLIT